MYKSIQTHILSYTVMSKKIGNIGCIGTARTAPKESGNQSLRSVVQDWFSPKIGYTPLDRSRCVGIVKKMDPSISHQGGPMPTVKTIHVDPATKRRLPAAMAPAALAALVMTPGWRMHKQPPIWIGRKRDPLGRRDGQLSGMIPARVARPKRKKAGDKAKTAYLVTRTGIRRMDRLTASQMNAIQKGRV